MTTALIISLNIVLSGFVIFGIVGLSVRGIITDGRDHPIRARFQVWPERPRIETRELEGVSVGEKIFAAGYSD
jgi:hypothetical protein